MKITVTSVFVDDQDKALNFYTNVLGFIKKTDVPVGDFKWLTVVSPDAPDGVELLLEPNDNPAARTFQQAIHQQGIPATSFGVDDIHKEHARLKSLGVAAHEAWMVGDNLEWEVVAPQRLGIYAIWYDGYGTGLPPGSPIRPDRIIRALPELLE